MELQLTSAKEQAPTRPVLDTFFVTVTAGFIIGPIIFIVTPKRPYADSSALELVIPEPANGPIPHRNAKVLCKKVSPQLFTACFRAGNW